MDIFQRSIHSNVKQTEGGRLLVASSLLDLEHSLHLELVVGIADQRIESARATMSKTPLARCARGVDGIPALAGVVIGRGVLREIHRRIGGPRGCAHLVELLENAVRLISMILIGKSMTYWGDLKDRMTEDEIVAEGKKALRDTCLVFADEPGTGRPSRAADNQGHGEEAQMVTKKDVKKAVKKAADKVVKAEKKVAKKIVKAEKSVAKKVVKKAAAAKKTVTKKAAAAVKTAKKKLSW
jgi:hypothetical protein